MKKRRRVLVILFWVIPCCFIPISFMELAIPGWQPKKMIAIAMIAWASFAFGYIIGKKGKGGET